MNRYEYKNANIKDFNTIWNLINEINKKEEKFICLEDYNIQHTEKSLKSILHGEKYEEKIMIVYEGDTWKGLIDYVESNADYLFCNDKYVYIRYFVSFDEADIKKIYEDFKDMMKKEGFNYIVKDLWLGQDEDYKTYQDLGFNLYRTRLMKELVQ